MPSRSFAAIAAAASAAIVSAALLAGGIVRGVRRRHGRCVEKVSLFERHMQRAAAGARRQVSIPRGLTGGFGNNHRGTIAVEHHFLPLA